MDSTELFTRLNVGRIPGRKEPARWPVNSAPLKRRPRPPPDLPHRSPNWCRELSGIVEALAHEAGNRSAAFAEKMGAEAEHLKTSSSSSVGTPRCAGRRGARLRPRQPADPPSASAAVAG